MRKKVLKELINLERPIGEIKSSLATVAWDADEEIVMPKEVLEAIITRFINGEISTKTLIDWANAIESREDIDYEEPYFDAIKRVVFEIANPDLQGAITEEKATEWIKSLS